MKTLAIRTDGRPVQTNTTMLTDGGSLRPGSSLKALLSGVIMLFATAAWANESGDRPDFSGYWMPNVGQGTSWPFNDPPFTEQGRAMWDAYVSEFDPDVDDPARLCVPEAMPRTMIQPPFPVEVIHREHDVTMFFEAWSQYRKLFMADRDHPPAILYTRMGHSVARWEDDTLVVETTHLMARDMGKILMSDQARIEERLRLEVDDQGHKRLINDITFHDEPMYTQPVRMRGVWDYSPDTPILEYVCTLEIWEMYIDALREDGERRF